MNNLHFTFAYFDRFLCAHLSAVMHILRSLHLWCKSENCNVITFKWMTAIVSIWLAICLRLSSPSSLKPPYIHISCCVIFLLCLQQLFLFTLTSFFLQLAWPTFPLGSLKYNLIYLGCIQGTKRHFSFNNLQKWSHILKKLTINKISNVIEEMAT